MLYQLTNCRVHTSMGALLLWNSYVSVCCGVSFALYWWCLTVALCEICAPLAICIMLWCSAPTILFAYVFASLGSLMGSTLIPSLSLKSHKSYIVCIILCVVSVVWRSMIIILSTNNKILHDVAGDWTKSVMLCHQNCTACDVCSPMLTSHGFMVKCL